NATNKTTKSAVRQPLTSREREARIRPIIGLWPTTPTSGETRVGAGYSVLLEPEHPPGTIASPEPMRRRLSGANVRHHRVGDPADRVAPDPRPIELGEVTLDRRTGR